jgi:ribosomal protein S18 acetylase RimI-like enzyme
MAVDKITEIRPIKPDERFFLKEMLNEAIFIEDAERKAKVLIEIRADLLKYFEDFGRAGDIGLVATEGGRLIGAIWTRLFDKQSGSYGFVDEQTPELGMAVVPEYRNRGIGRLLIEELFEKLRETGYSTVSLSVNKANQALNLYKRSGFQIFSEDENAFTMLKIL